MKSFLHFLFSALSTVLLVAVVCPVVLAQSGNPDTTKNKPKDPKIKKVKDIQTATATATLSASSATARIIPASPDVAALYKYTDIPVNYYTGSVGIDIPLYTVKTRDITLPLSISYHSSGVKVEEEASSVGLGWALNAGGAIQHIVRGKDDFRDFNGDSWRRLNALNANSPEVCTFYDNNFYLMFNAKTNSNLYSDTQNMTIVNGFQPYANYELDLFAFNFAGKSGKFVIEPLGNGGYRIRVLNQEDVKVKLINDDITGNSGFTITDSDGTKYFFEQKEVQQSRNTGLAGIRMVTGKSNDPNYATTWSDPYFDQISAYLLTKIESQGKDVVTLSYTATSDWVSSLPSRVESYSTLSPNETFRWDITESQTKLVYLNRIDFDNGWVEFQYADRQDLRLGSKRLTKMEVKASNGSQVQAVDFQQGYFDSGSGKDSFITKRLKLTGLRESVNGQCKPPYLFNYEESINLPDKNSYAQDYWGYYNGASINDQRNTMLPDVQISNEYKLSFPGADRNPSASHMKALSLRSITYPTGGTTTFNLGPHVYSNLTRPSINPNLIVHDFTGGNNQIGGGLRINSMTVSSGNGPDQTTNYQYVLPGGASTGKLMFGQYFANLLLTDFSGTGCGTNSTCFKTYLSVSSTSRLPAGIGAQGNPVGYTTVRVTKNGSGGYSEYVYQNNIDTRNAVFCIAGIHGAGNPQCVQSPLGFEGQCDPYTSGGQDYQSYSDPSLPNYVYVGNGNLVYEWHYNDANWIVRSVENQYESVQDYSFKIRNFKAVKPYPGANAPNVFVYYTVSEWSRLTKTIIKEFDPSPANDRFVETSSTFTYGNFHKQVINEDKLDSKGTLYRKNTVYNPDFNRYPELTNRNMVVPIEETLYRVQPDNQLALLEQKVTSYGNFFDRWLPSKIETKQSNQPLITQNEWTYNGDGNVETVKERDGIVTRFEYHGISGKKNLPERSTIGHGSGLARTTSYDYQPLVGLTKVTDPNNGNSTYGYDNLNRLKEVRDRDGNVVKSYVYNYGADVGCRTGPQFVSTPSNDPPPPPPPPTTCSNPLNAQNPSNTASGLNYRYFEIDTGWEPCNAETGLAGRTPKKSGNVANFNLAVAERNDNIGFEFTGYVDAPSEGQYTFYLSSDDDSRLYIDGQFVVAHAGCHGMANTGQEPSETVCLKAGRHTIKVLLSQAGGGIGLQVFWQGPGFGKQLLPNERLSRDASSQPPVGSCTQVAALVTESWLTLDQVQVAGSHSGGLNESGAIYQWIRPDGSVSNGQTYSFGSFNTAPKGTYQFKATVGSSMACVKIILTNDGSILVSE